jgi:CRP-like cAMP-binding protein
MTAPSPADLVANGLLSTLSEADRRLIAPQMMVFDLEAGRSLQRTGDDVVDTWFPCGSAMAAFCISTNDGENNVEVALIGREGAVGGIVSNGQVPAYATAAVRNSGRFLRIKTSALEQAKLDSITLRHWFSRYSDCLLAQVFQTAACNATHTVAQRTAKWLLAAAARTESDEFDLTQDQLAQMLGVGRTFVTKTLRQFRDHGLIATRRGSIAVRDEPGLRRASCFCTVAIEEHFDTVMHGVYPTA